MPEGKEPGRVCLFGCRGLARWQLRGKWDPVDVRLLPGNKLLVGESADDRVVDRTLEGDLLREQKVPERGRGSGVQSCRRLANGDTFVFNGRTWLVINDEGEQVLPLPDEARDQVPEWLSDAVWLGNGRVLCIPTSRVGSLEERGVESDNRLRTIAFPEGSYARGKAQLLPTGNLLVESRRENEPFDRVNPDLRKAKRFTELTRRGETAWQSEGVPGGPSSPGAMATSC
jgi:hypothetical protein